MARRTRVAHPRGARRKSLWLQFAPSRATLSAAGGTLFATLNAAALALEPFTIVRTRFMLYMQSDQSAAVEDQVAGFGIAVVTSQAAAAGVGSIPTPITDLGSSQFFVHTLLAAGQRTAADKSGIVMQVDSKAMRKVENQDDVAIVGEFSADGAGLQLTVGGRILIKLN